MKGESVKKIGTLTLLACGVIFFASTSAKSDEACSTIKQWYEGLAVVEGDQSPADIKLEPLDDDGFFFSAKPKPGFALNYVKLIYLIDGVSYVEETLYPQAPDVPLSINFSLPNAVFQFYEVRGCTNVANSSTSTSACLGSPSTALGHTGATQPWAGCYTATSSSTIASVISSTASSTNTISSNAASVGSGNQTAGGAGAAAAVAAPRFTG